MFKLKSTNGKVKCLLKTGKDFVRNEIQVSAAQHIIDTGKMEKSDKPDYPIHVGEWYFEGEPVKIEKNSAYGQFGKTGKK